MKNSSYLLEGNVPEGFSKIATHGAFWNVGFAAANKVVTLGGQLTLAWLLTPKDMGLAGMANAMAAFTAFLSAGSIGDVLIQRNKYSHEAGQGLWLSLFLSLATACLIALMSPFAALFGRGDLSGLLLVLVLPALAGFSNTILAAHLKHNLAFKNMAFTLFLEGMVYTTVTILLAWFGFGPYSLILSRVPSLLAGAGYMIFKTGWPPFEKPRWKSIQILFKPAFSLSVTGMLMGLQTQAPIFVVGLLLNSVMTGYFSWGWAVAGQAVYLLASNLRQ
ncbi:MAG TPA: oligosaccharide flippase family protein, partial [bacterium]